MRTAAHFLASLLIASALQLPALDALGTTVRALTLEALTAGAAAVVVGRVERIEHRRTESGRIVRDVTFRVEEFVVGGGPTEVTVRLLGGTVGGVSSHVTGAVELEAGQEAVLFLEHPLPTAGFYVPRGLSQGCFRVTTDPTTGTRFAQRSLDSALRMFGPPHDTYARPATSIYLPLETLLAEVRRIAERVGQQSSAP